MPNSRPEPDGKGRTARRTKWLSRAIRGAMREIGTAAAPRTATG